MGGKGGREPRVRRAARPMASCYGTDRPHPCRSTTHVECAYKRSVVPPPAGSAPRRRRVRELGLHFRGHRQGGREGEGRREGRRADGAEGEDRRRQDGARPRAPRVRAGARRRRARARRIAPGGREGAHRARGLRLAGARARARRGEARRRSLARPRRGRRRRAGRARVDVRAGGVRHEDQGAGHHPQSPRSRARQARARPRRAPAQGDRGLRADRQGSRAREGQPGGREGRGRGRAGARQEAPGEADRHRQGRAGAGGAHAQGREGGQEEGEGEEGRREGRGEERDREGRGGEEGGAAVRSGLLLGCCVLALAGGASAQHIDVPRTLGPAEGREALGRSLDWLVKNQNEDGSWACGVLDGLLELGFSIESFYAWQVASNALACLALLDAPETPERRAALERGLKWLDQTRPPKRGSDWDIDYVWGGLYGFAAAAEISSDPRFQQGEWKALVERIGRRYFTILEKNQIPEGGWGYYDDPVFSERPKWATSFSTSTVLPALKRAEELGWVTDAKIRERATGYVSRCALPNGAFAYDDRVIPWVGGDSINDVKGSLSRIQVCNWALSSVGEKKITLDRLRKGLEDFFEHHRFLDVAY